ncbi:hypothetical protein ABIA32_006501 [Streptacidiphilus sp. MAP12-20]|uniref:hypothetical protein n=1 Tax=Streptacidiphilus sp. MAP12-20 TaxID=3156299 RepID=UPI0035149349
MAVACLGACTSTRHPAPVATAVGQERGASASADPLADIEREVVQDAVTNGHTPVGGLTLVYRHRHEAVLLWQTTTQDICEEEYLLGNLLGSMCSPGLLPTGSKPTLRTVFGPASVDQWLTVLVAAGEEPRSFTCAGVRIALTKVGEVSTPGGAHFALYSYVAPWLAAGALDAEVMRPNGVTTLRMTLAPVPTDGHRDWIKNCD